MPGKQLRLTLKPRSRTPGSSLVPDVDMLTGSVSQRAECRLNVESEIHKESDG